MIMAKHEKFLYSASLYAYVPKPMKKEMDELRRIDPSRYSNSQIVEDALAAYLPQLKQRLSFSQPVHDAQGKKSQGRRRAS